MVGVDISAVVQQCVHHMDVVVEDSLAQRCVLNLKRVSSSGRMP